LIKVLQARIDIRLVSKHEGASFMKLGVLLCDHVQTALQEEFGDYSDMFSQIIAECDDSITIEYFAVVDGELPKHIDVCDAYMSTGSKASVNDDFPWVNALERLVWQLFLADKPFVGICFGHQMIAKALGGKVGRSNKGWGIGVATAIVNADKQWMLPKQNQLKLVVSHQEQIQQLPPETEVLMLNDFCPYGMIQVGKHFLGLQGHPEFSPEYCYALMHTRKNLIAKERFQQGINSLTLTVDAQLTMHWLINFLKQTSST